MSNINQLKSSFNRSHYKELYAFDNENRHVVMDELTENLYLKKKLSVFDEEVIKYLQSSSNIHIPKVVDYWKEDDSLIVIEEYLQGETLENYLQLHNLSEKDKQKIILEILDGVIFLHQANPPIIHRDLKASNIMIDKNNTVKIIDYDAAKTYQEGSNKDTVLIGTPGIAAPEQYGFSQSDVRTDIYSLGILIKDLFGDNPDMMRVVDKATQIDPNNRYDSVIQLKAAIEHPTKILSFLPLPGFRRNNIFHKIVAVCGYICIIDLTLTTPILKNGIPLSGISLVINRLCLFLMFMSIVDLYTDWTHIFHSLPYAYSSNKIKRYISRAIYTVALFLFFTLIAGLSDSLFN